MKLFVTVFILILKFNQADRWDNKYCNSAYVGDGLCDLQCNSQQWHWDGGDCCPITCKSKENHKTECGKLGYQCLEDIPLWFYHKIQLCFKGTPRIPQYPLECGNGNFPSTVCARPGEYTKAYLDDTDGRLGSCSMRWGLEKTDLSYNYPSWANNLHLCFRWDQKGTKGVCGSTLKNSCVQIGDYTVEYVDDSDDRVGPNNANACVMSWMIKIPDNSPEWAKRLNICLKVEATGNETQCSWVKKDRFCAKANKWTLFYHDGTDNKPGGCLLQWGLFFTGYDNEISI